MFSSYFAILQGKKPLEVQSFWKHIVRYRLFHLCIGVVLLGGWLIFVLNKVTPDYLQQVYGKVTTGIDQLYTPGLEISYDSIDWIATNASWPVVWTTAQVLNIFTPSLWSIEWSVTWWPKNLLTIDPSATVEEFASYDTMMLITQKYLIAQWNNDMRIVPLIQEDATTSTGIVITKELLTQVSTEWSTWLSVHGKDIRLWILYIVWGWWLLLLPFLALGIALSVSTGMLLVTLLSRWLSKIWVRVSYRQLFTRLSLSYLPVYVLLNIVMWSGVVPESSIIHYVAMIACLAVYIMRIEETAKEL